MTRQTSRNPGEVKRKRVSSMNLSRYAMAYGVRGFGKRLTSIRVNVTRVEGDYAWCRTASLRDAGTPLVLSLSQIAWEDELWAHEPVRHKDGLVAL